MNINFIAILLGVVIGVLASVPFAVLIRAVRKWVD